MHRLVQAWVLMSACTPLAPLSLPHSLKPRQMKNVYREVSLLNMLNAARWVNMG